MPQPILITGFGPFDGATRNPSEECLTLLRTELQARGVETLVLPVDYSQSFEKLQTRLAELQPDYLLMLGLSLKARQFRLELLARNATSTHKADNTGFTPAGELILAQAPAFYRSNVQVDEMVSLMRAQNLDFELSTDAGGYLCNYNYFRALHFIQANNLRTQALFIHTPLTDELVDDCLANTNHRHAIKTVPAASLEQLVRTLVSHWRG